MELKFGVPTIIYLLIFCIYLVYGELYVGMFKKNDFLVGTDHLHKERVPYRIQFAKYGRVFKCPITYMRVISRQKFGTPPKTQIIRGGLRKKYVVLKITAYNSPINVDIYVGCANNIKSTTTRKTTSMKTTSMKTTSMKTTSMKTTSMKTTAMDTTAVDITEIGSVTTVAGGEVSSATVAEGDKVVEGDGDTNNETTDGGGDAAGTTPTISTEGNVVAPEVNNSITDAPESTNSIVETPGVEDIKENGVIKENDTNMTTTTSDAVRGEETDETTTTTKTTIETTGGEVTEETTTTITTTTEASDLDS